jgi:hypothetical protein
MARALPSKVAFVLNAIAMTAAIALTADYFQIASPAPNPSLPVFLSQVHLPFASSTEAPSRGE